MAFETEMANLVGQTDVVSSAISKALVDRIVAVPLIYQEPVPEGTPVKLWRVEGSLTAEAITESAAYTASANSEYTETSVSATAAKNVVISKITVEAARFRNLTPGRILELQGNAIARLLDDNLIALTSGLSKQATNTSALSPQEFWDGIYWIESGNAAGNMYRALISAKQANNMRAFLSNTGAVIWTKPGSESIFAGMQQPNGYLGDLGSVSVFQVNGLPTSAGKDIGAIFNPDNAFGGMYDPSVLTQMAWVGASGLYWEITSYHFSKVVEWNDRGGCGLLSPS